ncbi:MAG: hypothetical protein H7145_21815 [Akkermansiaceae bacterium]|nr:hypothetical protein [Armatimonadota bacterium]
MDDWEAAQKRGDEDARRVLSERGAFLPDCDLRWATRARARYAAVEAKPLPAPALSDDAVRLLTALRETGIVSPGEPRPLLLSALYGVSDALTAHERERLRRQHAANQ